MAKRQKALEALADPTRRAIFEQLRDSEATVNELARQVPVSRPAVSQHLKVLKDAGLVRERRQGVHRIYCVELRGLIEIRRYIDNLWSDVLTELQRAVSKQTAL